MRTKLVAGNWKMNLSFDEARELYHLLSKLEYDAEVAQLLIAPPAIYLSQFAFANSSELILAAQNWIDWIDNQRYCAIDFGGTCVLYGYRVCTDDTDSRSSQAKRRALPLSVTYRQVSVSRHICVSWSTYYHERQWSQSAAFRATLVVGRVENPRSPAYRWSDRRHTRHSLTAR